MPILNWIGKDKIVNHDKEVPFRLLRKNKKYSLGKSENLIVEGDNLEALKALMPFYYGKIQCLYKVGKVKLIKQNVIHFSTISYYFWLGRGGDHCNGHRPCCFAKDFFLAYSD